MTGQDKRRQKQGEAKQNLDTTRQNQTQDEIKSRQEHATIDTDKTSEIRQGIAKQDETR
jgi:hypothetical protein